MEFLTCCCCNGLFDHTLPYICSQVSCSGARDDPSCSGEKEEAGSTRRNQRELKHESTWHSNSCCQDCKVLLVMVDMSLSNCPTNKNLLWLKPGCFFIKKPYRYISIYIACVRRFYGQPSEGTSKKEAEGGVVKLWEFGRGIVVVDECWLKDSSNRVSYKATWATRLHVCFAEVTMSIVLNCHVCHLTPIIGFLRGLATSSEWSHFLPRKAEAPASVLKGLLAWYGMMRWNLFREIEMTEQETRTSPYEWCYVQYLCHKKTWRILRMYNSHLWQAMLVSNGVFRNLHFKESEEVSKPTAASIDLSLTSRILGHRAPLMITDNCFVGVLWSEKRRHPKVLSFVVDRKLQLFT